MRCMRSGGVQEIVGKYSSGSQRSALGRACERHHQLIMIFKVVGWMRWSKGKSIKLKTRGSKLKL